MKIASKPEKDLEGNDAWNVGLLPGSEEAAKTINKAYKLVIAHEIGHTLGLYDEYPNSTTAMSWARWGKEHKLNRPWPFGEEDSLMYGGGLNLYARHLDMILHDKEYLFVGKYAKHPFRNSCDYTHWLDDLKPLMGVGGDEVLVRKYIQERILSKVTK